jgi:hypothetical protein
MIKRRSLKLSPPKTGCRLANLQSQRPENLKCGYKFNIFRNSEATVPPWTTKTPEEFQFRIQLHNVFVCARIWYFSRRQVDLQRWRITSCGTETSGYLSTLSAEERKKFTMYSLRNRKRWNKSRCKVI